MANQDTWYPIVRDAFAEALGVSAEQLLKIKNPDTLRAVRNAIVATAKYLADEDLKAWNAARQPPAEDIFEMSRRAWGELKTRAEKEAVLQRIIDGR